MSKIAHAIMLGDGKAVFEAVNETVGYRTRYTVELDEYELRVRAEYISGRSGSILDVPIKVEPEGRNTILIQL